MNIFDYSISLLSFRDIWMLATVILCFLVMLDDIFVDVLAFIVKAKPHKITRSEFDLMNALNQRRVAILIANWHEDQVLERMVTGNIKNIDYRNYEFILGVYPNDTATVEAARRAAKRHPNVRVYVNTMNGPTSKGQMINQMVRYIDEYNSRIDAVPYDLIVTQDAEDMIHRYALKLINMRARDYDFIQIPVLSLEIPLTKLTAGIYVDEFTESHTKNLLVRDRYQAGVPSAGVGTAVSRSIVSRLLKLQNGNFLKEDTLTEDYFLGLTCYDLNVKAHFAAEYFEYQDTASGEMKRDYIATREYFPQKIGASIKQKTRWIMGICLQGYEQARRKSTRFFGSYFLWRDRKGLWSAPLFLSAVAFTVYFLGTYLLDGVWPSLDYAPYGKVFMNVMWANLILSVVRILHRVILVEKVYGLPPASLVPLRWLLSNFINNVATFNAAYLWMKSKVSGQAPVWAKTDHIIPADFGLEHLDFTEDDVIPAPQGPRIPTQLQLNG